MKYTIMITQTLRGYVEIEAPDEWGALEAVEERFSEKGECLPDMDDSEGLRYQIVSREK